MAKRFAALRHNVPLENDQVSVSELHCLLLARKNSGGGGFFLACEDFGRMFVN